MQDGAEATTTQTHAPGHSRPRTILRRLVRHWKLFLVSLLPLVLLPMIVVPGTEIRCAYMLIIMAVFWVTEAMPVAVTALLPIVMCPLLGIASGKTITKNYANDTIFLFLGGLTVAICVETWNLHKRIAIRMLLLVGISPRWLMLGFMCPTWFLSMWISNTATTAMMIPITAAVLEQIKHMHNKSEGPEPVGNDASEMVNIGEKQQHLSPDETSLDDGASVLSAEPPPPDVVEYDNLCKAMSLCIAYSANCGGIATLTGTGPNLVLVGQLDELFGDDHGINFVTWMGFALPISLISMLTCWIWLGVYYLGPRKMFLCTRGGSDGDMDVRYVLQEEYNKLGKMSFAEMAVTICFAFLVFLWIFRVSEFFSGWGALFISSYATDGTAAIFVACLLFIIPSAPIRLSKPQRPAAPLMNWETLASKMPWGVLLLLGGGFAIADASQSSGLSVYLGQQLAVLEALPPALIVLCVATLIAAVTEVSSNTATTALMLPILAAMARSMNMNPLYLMLPGTVSASFAFMLPVATPPNAVVFSYGHLKITDMIKAGVMMNIICILYVTMAVNTWGLAYFNLEQVPAWAVLGNATTTTIGPTLANSTV